MGASDDLNKHELDLWNKRDRDCDSYAVTEDFVFAYPSGFFADLEPVKAGLQNAMVFLKEITGLNPKNCLHSRVFVTYSRDAKSSTWSAREGNRVRIPNKYLGMKNEPLDTCSHELVHPFFFVSPLHKSNEPWGEGFCDFLRGPVKHVMGLDGKGWLEKMVSEVNNQKSTHQAPAGELVLMAQRALTKDENLERFTKWFVDDPVSVRAFVTFLFIAVSERRLSTVLDPTDQMKEDWPDSI